MKEISEINDFEVVAMRGLLGINIPSSIKQEVGDWKSEITKASADELTAMIPKASNLSCKEEVLAQEFVRRKIDTRQFLEKAKFRTTKAILMSRLKE